MHAGEMGTREYPQLSGSPPLLRRPSERHPLFRIGQPSVDPLHFPASAGRSSASRSSDGRVAASSAGEGRGLRHSPGSQPKAEYAKVKTSKVKNGKTPEEE